MPPTDDPVFSVVPATGRKPCRPRVRLPGTSLSMTGQWIAPRDARSPLLTRQLAAEAARPPAEAAAVAA
jgi:hypothetical protein